MKARNLWSSVVQRRSFLASLSASINHRPFVAYLLAPVTLFVGTLLLYLSTLTQVHTFDALSYVTSVERKPWDEIFHPHHLAYGPLGIVVLRLSQGFGVSGGAALPMQVVNALAGALGVALFFIGVRRVTRRGDVALVAALLLGGAYAYWYYAVEIEVYTLATLFLIICLNVLTRIIEQPTITRYLLLGLVQGGAVLFHQTNMLLCVPILGLMIYDYSVRSPLFVVGRCLLAYGFMLTLIVALPYGFVGVVSGFGSISDFVAWMTEYARTGWWGGPVTANTWARLATGMTETFMSTSGVWLLLVLIGLATLHWRGLLDASQPLVAALLAWLLAYGGFFFWWEADNIEFWIANLPPLLLLLALTLTRGRRWGPGVLVALGLAAAMLATNYTAIVRRGNERNDLQRLVARSLKAHTTRADLIIVADELQQLYLPYYERHDNFTSINQTMFASGGNWQQACNLLRGRIEAALHAGAAALIADAVLHPPQALLQRHNIAQPQVDLCFTPYRASLVALPMPTATPPYWRLPTSQERVEHGWLFDNAPNGWRTTNVRDEQFARGWTFTPERDPSLTSPLLNLDARQYTRIEIRLANATNARDAQLFFAGPDGAISEARSLRWTLAPTTDAVTYTLDLRNVPRWHQIITRLRLDPVGVGDGGAVRVERIRLQR